VVEPTERFTALVRRPEPEIPLDEAVALIAAHARPDLEVARVLADLDALADEFPGEDAAALARHLFVDLGFAGNTVDYGDPRNSYLDEVLSRRLGIPISLSVVMVEVGRRRGVVVSGVGMPGHFLVRSDDETPPTWFDPFHGGRMLDEGACRDRFHEVRGADVPFLPEYLEPAPTTEILRRMLANLARTLLGRDPSSAVWALRLRLRLRVTTRERHEVASLLGSLGRFGEAAAELDEVASGLTGDDAERVGRQAAALRARGN
jgi:regulator of sirC expression with transglutaminase-like and TPR domain